MLDDWLCGTFLVIKTAGRWISSISKFMWASVRLGSTIVFVSVMPEGPSWGRAKLPAGYSTHTALLQWAGLEKAGNRSDLSQVIGTSVLKSCQKAVVPKCLCVLCLSMLSPVPDFDRCRCSSYVSVCHPKALRFCCSTEVSKHTWLLKTILLMAILTIWSCLGGPPLAVKTSS